MVVVVVVVVVALLALGERIAAALVGLGAVARSE